jgi:hypothetical protein
LRAQYGSDFSIGMDEQTRACIKDCDEVGLVNMRRKNTQMRGPL